ncbi:retinol dehydrogenase 12-like [Dermacentor silvarum]|uniref:retinol dehydrogenase 12-like n=1 Tax=Dermacentor silvarum TaxID=543639 RepID=UPI0021007961|nr:retinol dehydrogenase 12-like [Dermacentor silvarum]
MLCATLAQLATPQQAECLESRCLETFQRCELFFSAHSNICNNRNIQFLAGHFFFLRPEKLRKSAPSRIVNVSSDSHCSGDVSQLEAKARGRCTLRTPFSVYSNSKLAMSLYTVALADKLKNTGVTVNSLNPGLVQTPIASHGSLLRKLIIQVGLFIKGKTAVQGAQTTIQLAVDPALDKTTGEYFEECVLAVERYRNPLLKDRALAEDVLRASVKLVGFDQLRLQTAIGSP